MRITSLCIAAFASSAIAEQFTLTARRVDSDQSLPLGVFDYEKNPLVISQVSTAEQTLSEEDAYCIDATFVESGRTIPCFSYLEVQSPLQYSLIVDAHGDEISKLSFVYNSGVEGIVPIIRRPSSGPAAPAIKLKKVTKTYKDVKAAKDAATVQFKDEGEADDRSWIQKNWKMLLIGLVVYNVITISTRRQQSQQSE